MVGAASSDPLPQATDCFALERCCLKDKQDITFTITAKDHVVSLTAGMPHQPCFAFDSLRQVENEMKT